MTTNYNRPGGRFYANSSLARVHGQACQESNYVGVAQKQKQPASDQGLSVQANIAVAEPFCIITKGIVTVPFVATSVKGSTVWINVTNDVLTLTDPGGGNGRKFGRVHEIQGQRATPTGFMRVDLDAKDSF